MQSRSDVYRCGRLRILGVRTQYATSVNIQARFMPDVQRKILIVITSSCNIEYHWALLRGLYHGGRGWGEGNYFLLGDQIGKFRCDHGLENLARKISYSGNSQFFLL